MPEALVDRLVDARVDADRPEFVPLRDPLPLRWDDSKFAARLTLISPSAERREPRDLDRDLVTGLSAAAALIVADERSDLERSAAAAGVGGGDLYGTADCKEAGRCVPRMRIVLRRLSFDGEPSNGSGRILRWRRTGQTTLLLGSL